MKKRFSIVVLLLLFSLPHSASAVVRPSTLPPPTNNKPQAVRKSIADYRRSVKPSMSKRLQVAPEKKTNEPPSEATSQQLLSIFAE